MTIATAEPVEPSGERPIFSTVRSRPPRRGAGDFVRKNAAPFLVGIGISYGVKAAFAIAAAHIVAPAAIVAVVPIVTASLAGGVTKLLVNKIVYKQSFTMRTFVQGCFWGAVGGALGQYLYHAAHVAHHVTSAVPKPVPVAAAVPPSVPVPTALEAAKTSLSSLKSAALIAHDKALSHLVDQASASQNAATVEHGIKEAAFRLTWGKGHTDATRGIAKELLRRGASLVNDAHSKGVNARMILRDTGVMDKLFPKIAAAMPSP